MDLEKITIQKVKGFNPKEYLKLIENLKNTPEETENFNALYNKTINIINKYGNKSLFGWHKEAKINKKEFELKVECNKKNFCLESISIYLNHDYKKEIIGLSKQKKNVFGKFYPHEFQATNITNNKWHVLKIHTYNKNI